MKENHTTLYPNAIVGHAVSEYADRHSLDISKELIEFHSWVLETQDQSYYTISMLEARFLYWITRLIGANRVLEVGAFVGFSVAVWADAVGPKGRVIGIERSSEYAKVAREQLESRGWKNTEIFEGNAAGILGEHTPSQPYDIIFIDAQKSEYPKYLDTILQRSKPEGKTRLLRVGGLIIGDNVLRSGLVVDQSDANPATQAVPRQTENWTWSDVEQLDEFNRRLHIDRRLESVLLPVFDGLGMARLLD